MKGKVAEAFVYLPMYICRDGAEHASYCRFERSAIHPALFSEPWELLRLLYC